jgi:hypothetical protein
MDAPTVAAGNENCRILFDTMFGGTLANRAILWGGLSIGSTAADQGVGTLNVDVGYYWQGIAVVNSTGITVPTGKVAVPQTNDGAALGTTALQWSDLFLASGGVINWANGNYTVTHSSGTLTFSGAVLSSGTGGIGYATGAGGAVTQATSRTTGVTLNKPSGAITMFTAAGSATPASFTVTNSSVAATDTISLGIKSGATNTYFYFVTAVAAGSFVITFWTTGGTASDTPVINFNVIKGVSA